MSDEEISTTEALPKVSTERKYVLVTPHTMKELDVYATRAAAFEDAAYLATGPLRGTVGIAEITELVHEDGRMERVISTTAPSAVRADPEYVAALSLIANMRAEIARIRAENRKMKRALEVVAKACEEYEEVPF